MIFATLETLPLQASLTPGLHKALDFLRQSAGKDLPEGRLEIDGTQVYALVQAYTSRPANQAPRFEAHRKYLDVQFVISGKELFGWAPLEKLSPTDEYDPEKDVVHGSVPLSEAALLPLTAGQMVLVYPWDAHAPGLAAGAPSPVKKIVIKVAV